MKKKLLGQISPKNISSRKLAEPLKHMPGLVASLKARGHDIYMVDDVFPYLLDKAPYVIVVLKNRVHIKIDITREAAFGGEFVKDKKTYAKATRPERGREYELE